MIRKVILLGMTGLLLTGGCDKAVEYQQAKQASRYREAPAVSDLAKVRQEKEEFKNDPHGGSKRYIAMRHHCRSQDQKPH